MDQYFLDMSNEANSSGRNVQIPEAIARVYYGNTVTYTNGFLIGDIRWGGIPGREGNFPFFYPKRPNDQGTGRLSLADLPEEQKPFVTVVPPPGTIPSLTRLAALSMQTTDPSGTAGPYLNPNDPDNRIPLEIRDATLKKQLGGRRYSRTKVNMPRRHTKKRGTRKRKQRGGFYSFEGATAPGAAQWGRGSEMGEFAVDKSGNMSNMGPNGMRSEIQHGRGRRRKSRGRKTKRRQRGGGKYGGVSASYLGTGSRGIADRVGVNTRVPPLGEAANGAFNNFGADSLDNVGSFNILPK